MQQHTNNFKDYLLTFQKNCINQLENFEKNKKFEIDSWQPNSNIIQSGECHSCVLENGKVFAKAGVSFSHVFGNQLPPSALQNRNNFTNSKFEAMGISIVIHPVNPFVPTSHANLRLFVTNDFDNTQNWWFGGGFDLTPYYGFIEDCVSWHQAAKDACDPFGHELYNKFKNECDEYFYLPHRQEPRGIGGLFFDNLKINNFDTTMRFIQAVGQAYINAYTDIVSKRHLLPYTDQHLDFQSIRRGRYVEFNLLYDRGTLFGLQSGGRTESILMSLPPRVTWKYNHQPALGSEESKLYDIFLKKRDWLDHLNK